MITFLYTLRCIPFVYPYAITSGEWLKMPIDERRETAYIPEWILGLMTTDQLIINIIESPGAIYMLAYPKSSMDGFTNIHRELRTRTDAPQKLLAWCKELREADDPRFIYIDIIMSEGTYWNALTPAEKEYWDTLHARK